MENNWFEFDHEHEKIGILMPGKKPLIITKEDLDISFFSTGHGGQNVNRHMNGVRLIYRIPVDFQLPFRRTKMIISRCNSQRHQEHNFKEAFFHLAEKLQDYYHLHPHRKKTKVPFYSKMKRLSEKRHHSHIKHERGKVNY